MHGVAGLQHRLEHLRSAAVNQAEMAPMGARHQLEDEARFTMLAGAEHHALVGPLHASKPVLRG
jgi:hypothetical protein